MSDLEIAPVGKIWDDKADNWVDDSEQCDVDYACTFPPCVAEREAEGQKYMASFHRADAAVLGAFDDEAYEPGDPKRPAYFDRLTDRLEVSL